MAPSSKTFASGMNSKVFLQPPVEFNGLNLGNKYSSQANSPKRKQLLLYGLFMIGGQYMWARWHRWGVGGGWGNISYEEDWRGKVYRWVNRVEKYAKVLTLLNYIVFLCNGR